jgi:hypothetical protein
MRRSVRSLAPPSIRPSFESSVDAGTFFWLQFFPSHSPWWRARLNLRLLPMLEVGSAAGENLSFSSKIHHTDNIVSVFHRGKAASPTSTVHDGYIRPTDGGYPREFSHANDLIVVLQGRKVDTPSSDIGDGCFRPVSACYLQPLRFYAIT